MSFECLRCGHKWIPRVELAQLEGELKISQEFVLNVNLLIGI